MIVKFDFVNVEHFIECYFTVLMLAQSCGIDETYEYSLKMHVLAALNVTFETDEK